MNDQAKRQILKQLHDVARNTFTGSTGPSSNRRTWFLDDELAISISEPYAEEFERVANRLAREEVWRDKWSVQYIEKELLSILMSIQREGSSSAKELFERLASRVDDYAEERTVYVPISGLILEKESLAVGNVVFKRSSVHAKEQIVAKITEHHQRLAQEVKALFPLEAAQEVMIRPLKTETHAEYKVTAEPIRAAERAQDESRRAAEILTLACAARFPFSAQGNTAVSLQGETFLQGPVVTVVSDENMTAFQSAPPSAMPVTIDESSLRSLQAIGVLDLMLILSKPVRHLNEMERSLLRSVHWLATAQAQVQLENRLLNLITSIEVLLTPKDRSPISTSVSEGAALIMERTYQERKELKSFLGKMYGARSGVSHGGTKEVFESEVRQLRYVASQLILRVVKMRNKLETKADLLEWIERQRLGPSPN